MALFLELLPLSLFLFLFLFLFLLLLLFLFLFPSSFSHVPNHWPFPPHPHLGFTPRRPSSSHLRPFPTRPSSSSSVRTATPRAERHHHHLEPSDHEPRTTNNGRDIGSARTNLDNLHLVSLRTSTRQYIASTSASHRCDLHRICTLLHRCATSHRIASHRHHSRPSTVHFPPGYEVPIPFRTQSAANTS